MNKKVTAALPLRDIQLDDRYWNRYTKLIPDVVIPYQWRVLNDSIPDVPPSYCIRNLRIAAGEEQGERQGTVFLDTDVAKWLEAVAYSLSWRPDSVLEKTADEVISLIGRAQCDDGYLNTYYTLVEPDRRWQNLTAGHELYCAGHFMEAAAAYFETTGKSELLDIVCRLGDLLCQTFGPESGQNHGYPGHPEVELALVKLYRATGNERYMELARYFVNTRGKSPNYFIDELAGPDYRNIYPEFQPYDPAYSQSHMPVRQQEAVEGHAVRAVYLYCAMADIAGIDADGELLERCKILWSNMVDKRMYITGGIGSSGFLERFTADYDLPNDTCYAETCASIGLAQFGLRMSRLTRDASYIDVVERALYNTVRAGISLEGDRYFYVNPLEVWPDICMEHTSRAHVKPVRQKWFDVACCPTNIARTFTSFGSYIYSAGDDELFVNLFVQNTATIQMNDKQVKINLKTDYPRSGNISLVVEGGGAEFALYIRIPAFAENFCVCIDGEKDIGTAENGYYRIYRQWNNEQIGVSFLIRPRLVYSNPLVRANVGKVALIRGPEVYCFEEADNRDDLAAIYLDPNTELMEIWDDSLLGGTMCICCQGYRLSPWSTDKAFDIVQSYQKQPVSLTAIPYGSWNNRSPGEMIVWVHSTI